MSKLGGGTSGYFGHIRHRGAAVKNNGEASGSVHIMQLFETMVDVVSQGSVRRGRFSPYLPVEHKDILEFLESLNFKCTTRPVAAVARAPRERSLC